MVVKHTRAPKQTKSIKTVKVDPRAIFLQNIPLRDFILLMFYEWGRYKQYMNAYRKHNTAEEINQEIEKMLEDRLLEKGKNDAGKEINILKVPDGFDAIDKVLKEWPIYSLNSCVERVRSVALRVFMQKYGVRQED